MVNIASPPGGLHRIISSRELGLKCIASGCMLWRLADPDRKDSGYCGLGGKID
jgi:hypothetical protein